MRCDKSKSTLCGGPAEMMSVMRCVLRSSDGLRLYVMLWCLVFVVIVIFYFEIKKKRFIVPLDISVARRPWHSGSG